MTTWTTTETERVPALSGWIFAAPDGTRFWLFTFAKTKKECKQAAIEGLYDGLSFRYDFPGWKPRRVTMFFDFQYNLK